MRGLTQPQSGNILRCPLAHFYSAVDNLSPERALTRDLLAEQGIRLVHFGVRDASMLQADVTLLGQTVSVDWLPDDKNP